MHLVLVCFHASGSGLLSCIWFWSAFMHLVLVCFHASGSGLLPCIWFWSAFMHLALCCFHASGSGLLSCIWLCAASMHLVLGCFHASDSGLLSCIWFWAASMHLVLVCFHASGSELLSCIDLLLGCFHGRGCWGPILIAGSSRTNLLTDALLRKHLKAYTGMDRTTSLICAEAFASAEAEADTIVVLSVDCSSKWHYKNSARRTRPIISPMYLFKRLQTVKTKWLRKMNPELSQWLPDAQRRQWYKHFLCLPLGNLWKSHKFSWGRGGDATGIWSYLLHHFHLLRPPFKTLERTYQDYIMDRKMHFST